MAEPRILKLGELEITEGKFEFRPASPLRFDARQGEEVLFGVKYRYEEASTAKEATHLELSVHLGSRPMLSNRLEIGDMPGRHDESWGFLTCRARMGEGGPLRGKFHLDGTSQESGWSGAKSQRRSAKFHHEGTFELKVE